MAFDTSLASVDRRKTNSGILYEKEGTWSSAEGPHIHTYNLEDYHYPCTYDVPTYPKDYFLPPHSSTRKPFRSSPLAGPALSGENQGTANEGICDSQEARGVTFRALKTPLARYLRSKPSRVTDSVSAIKSTLRRDTTRPLSPTAIAPANIIPGRRSSQSMNIDRDAKELSARTHVRASPRKVEILPGDEANRDMQAAEYSNETQNCGIIGVATDSGKKAHARRSLRARVANFSRSESKVDPTEANRGGYDNSSASGSFPAHSPDPEGWLVVPALRTPPPTRTNSVRASQPLRSTWNGDKDLYPSRSASAPTLSEIPHYSYPSSSTSASSYPRLPPPLYARPKVIPKHPPVPIVKITPSKSPSGGKLAPLKPPTPILPSKQVHSRALRANPWYEHHSQAITPPFTRAGLSAPGIVLPVSKKEWRRSSASSEMNSHLTVIQGRSFGIKSKKSSLSVRSDHADSMCSCASGATTPQLQVSYDTDTDTDYHSDVNASWVSMPESSANTNDGYNPYLSPTRAVAGSGRTRSNTASTCASASSMDTLSTDTLLASPSALASSASSMDPRSMHGAPKSSNGDLSVYASQDALPQAGDIPPVSKRKSVIARMASWRWLPSASVTSDNSPHAQSAAKAKARSMVELALPADASDAPSPAASPVSRDHVTVTGDKERRNHSGHEKSRQKEKGESKGAAGVQVAYLDVGIVDAGAKARSWRMSLKSRRSVKRAWNSLLNGRTATD